MTEQSSNAETSLAELQARFDKLKRRQKRNERAAWAEGFLTGVCGALRSGDVVIDCGANVGDVSARLLQTGAEVVAFDPEPWAVQALSARFSDEPRFTLHNAAVGIEEGTVLLRRAANFEGHEKSASVKSTVISGGRAIDDDEGQTIEVPQIDFVAFMKNIIRERGEVAFLKMDIEGAELDLLPALDKAGVFEAIRCTVVETHESKFKQLRPRFRELRENFAKKYSPNHVNLDWI